MTQNISTVCLIPARSGSKRIANKNIMDINGHPLLAYTISTAINSGVFDAIIVSTNSTEYADIAKHYGAEVPFLRPSEFSEDLSPDIEWVKYTLNELLARGRNFDHFSILRPTSPFRTEATIRRAMVQFSECTYADSIRAVELCTQHPGKMWTIVDNFLIPLLPAQSEGVEWYSSPTQSLPKVWVQNASLEIARTNCVTELNSISGKRILSFKTLYPEGLDLNTPADEVVLRSLVGSSPFLLPKISQSPYSSTNR